MYTPQDLVAALNTYLNTPIPEWVHNIYAEYAGIDTVVLKS